MKHAWQLQNVGLMKKALREIDANTANTFQSITLVLTT